MWWRINMFGKDKTVKPKKIKKINPVKAKKIIDAKLKAGRPLTKDDLELCQAIRKERLR
jgi:DNA uptake protein ComE-like DNA-binding protein